VLDPVEGRLRLLQWYHVFIAIELAMKLRDNAIYKPLIAASP
jgi:hypothetical protein